MSSDSSQTPESKDTSALIDSAGSTASTVPTENTASTETNQSPLRLREILAILAIVVVADLLIYRGHGYFGVSVMLLVIPVILAVVSSSLRLKLAVWLSAGALVLFALRISWHATPLRIVCALFTLTSLAHAAHRNSLALRGIAWFPVQIIPAGVSTIFRNVAVMRFSSSGKWTRPLLSVVIPLTALLVFGSIFVLANPDAVKFVENQFRLTMEFIDSWLSEFSLPAPEVILWCLAAILTAGFLRPQLLPKDLPADDADARNQSASQASPLYPAFRNTLLSVIVLFAIYLVYEFSTLWFREFPEGFYYAGYAHEGAFWLTVALGMASAVLSFMFRGTILDDARYHSLRRLAWVWCLLNGLLVFAVYNRLFIYVGFNGLTHLRIVGVFGISSVVAGFVLVIIKIARHQTFLWLVGRQVWALVLTIMVYAICPVDYIAVSYNANRILAGDSSAVMQIGVQDIDIEGVLVLPKLLDSGDAEIREGVRALMAEHYSRLQLLQETRNRLGWTTLQFGDEYALRRLERWKPEWSRYDDPSIREQALQKFYDYAYQWY